MTTKFYFNKQTQKQYKHRTFIVTGICIMLLMFGLTGCKKFLDLPSVDKVPEAIVFQDEQGFKDAMIGVYLALDKPTNGGAYSLYTKNISMGMLSAVAYNYDNANTANAGEGSSFYNNLIVYNYADASVKAEMDGVWGGMYNTITNVNNVLRQIDDKKGLFTKDNYYRVKGEAIGARAMLHFDLLRLYGQSPAVPATKKAIPYVRIFDVRPTHFSTLNEALDSCLNDLYEAKGLLALTDTTQLLQAANDLYAAYTQNHINYWMVEALLARAHLYKGNYDSAAYYATRVIGSIHFLSSLLM
jgi:starch-binding outer membrane protein, SusD/RagB family